MPYEAGSWSARIGRPHDVVESLNTNVKKSKSCRDSIVCARTKEEPAVERCRRQIWTAESNFALAQDCQNMLVALNTAPSGGRDLTAAATNTQTSSVPTKATAEKPRLQLFVQLIASALCSHIVIHSLPQPSN